MSWQGAGSGAAQGAGMGSMVMPGIGTAVGAGVGALLGWLGSRKNKKQKGTDALIQQLLAQQMQQYQQQQPLRDAVQGMAMNRLRAVYPNMPSSPTSADPMAQMLQSLSQRR